MWIFRYIKMTFIDDLKNNLFYILVLIFSIVIIFYTFNVVLNEQIVAYKSKEYMDLSLLSFIVLPVSIMFMIFANSYYLEEKFNEYAVIALSGRSIGDICKIVIVRSFIVTIVSVGIGCTIGATSSYFVMKTIFRLIGTNIEGNYISQNALVLTFITIFTELESVFLINTGSIYRKSINELVNRKKRVYIKDNRRIKLNPIIYILIYLLPLAAAFIPVSIEEKVYIISIAIVVGVFGVQGIIRYVIPDGIVKYKKQRLITDKCKLIMLSNLHYSIQKSIILMLFLVISTVLTISILGQYKIGTVVNIMSLICYGLIIVVMSITVVYKFLIEAKSRKENFEQLKLLGYTKAEIRKTIEVEVMVYYSIIILLALVYIALVSLGSVVSGLMSPTIGVAIVLAYVVSFILTSIVSYLGYRKLAL